MPSSSLFLSALSPGPADRRIAVAVVFVSLVFFVAVAPFAKVPLAPVPAFLPMYQSALVMCDLITAVMLLGQYGIVPSRALLVLASGYLFSAAMAVAHALSFPGLFAPAGLLGAGPQTTAWIYFLWHGGFPLFIMGYALLKTGSRERGSGNIASHIVLGVVLALASAAALTLLATSGHELLPPIMSGNADAPMKVVVAGLTWLFGLAALFVLWRRSPHSVLDLWLMIVLIAWTADSALASVLNHARYDVGWYAGRVYGLFASGFVLAVLLLENGVLHARLAKANVQLKATGDELSQAVAQLEIANRDLSRFAGAIAHDLQQPMLSIQGFATMVHKHAAQILSLGDAAGLKRIVATAQNADRMIQALLQFARLGEKDIRTIPVDLNELVEEARRALARELEENAVVCRVGQLPVVQGDPSLIQLALVNLLSNGIKYTRTREQRTIEIDSTFNEASGHAVSVRDNGVGFDMAHATRLFAPFERLHSAAEFEGTGMGLANVRRIMERHGGSIRADSAPGRGATFTLMFPA
jgi:signal transduction histidine kinase